jgi:PAS domain-containing protein
MDIRIGGPLDGIQSARLLRQLFQVPAVFLTSHSDGETVTRAAQELPYGFLTKPFRSCELIATLSVALHKAAADAQLRESNGAMSATVQGMHEATIFVSGEGNVEFMNLPAEQLTGLKLIRARGMLLSEVLDMTDIYRRRIPMPVRPGGAVALEEFGWFLQVPGRERQIVDFTVRFLDADGDALGGHVITLRDASQRMRQNQIEASKSETDCFDNSPVAMVQLDGYGRIVRINQTLLDESCLPMELLIGRTISGLLADPDPRIATQFVHGLLRPFRPLQDVLTQ